MDITVAVLADELSWEELDPLVDATVDVEYVGSYDNAVDPVTLTLIIGGVLALAKVAIGLWNEWRGGVLIDLSRNPVQVGRTRAVPVGFFLVIAQDGESVEIDGRDEPTSALERLAAAVLGLAVDPAGATAEAVRGAVAGVLPGGSSEA